MTRSTAQAQTFLNPNGIDRLNRIAATLGFVTTSVGFPYLTHETLESCIFGTTPFGVFVF